MSITKEDKLRNTDEMIDQYLSLILKTINFIYELLRERKEIIKNMEK